MPFRRWDAVWSHTWMPCWEPEAAPYPFTGRVPCRHNTPQINNIGEPKVQEREAAAQFSSGGIVAILLKQDPGRGGWTLVFQMRDGERIPLENKRGRCIRLFKTSDAALRWCQRIGFREARIQL